jgi:putative sterol carrier protein
MSLEEVTAGLQARIVQAPSLGHTLLIDFGADGVIFWDGTQTPALVDNTKRDAETTLLISLDDFKSLAKHTLDPTMAYMTGKLRVEGPLTVAMKLSQILGD